MYQHAIIHRTKQDEGNVLLRIELYRFADENVDIGTEHNYGLVLATRFR